MMSHVKRAAKVHGDASIPVGRVDVVNSCHRSGDACVVYQRIQRAVLLIEILKYSINVHGFGYVGMCCCRRGIGSNKLGNHFGRRVADVDVGAVSEKGLSNTSADA